MHLLPLGTEADRSSLARGIQHASIKDACSWITAPNKAPSHARAAIRRAAGNTLIVDIAIAFQTLQEARHAADYDHLADFTKPSTLSYLAMARDAVNKLGQGQRECRVRMPPGPHRDEAFSPLALGASPLPRQA